MNTEDLNQYSDPEDVEMADADDEDKASGKTKRQNRGKIDGNGPSPWAPFARIPCQSIIGCRPGLATLPRLRAT